MALYSCKFCSDNNLLADEVVFRYSNVVRSCKKCKREQQNLHRKLFGRKDKTSNKQNKINSLKQNYNISLIDYNKKNEIQLEGCAICRLPCRTGRNLAVDHDHKTKINRDLLCYRCNLVLGYVDDNEKLLIEFIEYIKKHQCKIA